MKKYTVILIENDEDEQLFMKEAFDTSGLFEVMDMLNSGDELLEWLSNEQRALPDAIISDLNMPGKNGYDVIEYIKATPAYTHIPVIITSTSATRSTMEKCLTMGAVDYLVKPDTFIQYVPFVSDLYTRIERKRLIKGSSSIITE